MRKDTFWYVFVCVILSISNIVVMLKFKDIEERLDTIELIQKGRK